MKQTKKMVLTALLIALGIILPMAFHSIPNGGKILLPMHLPVLLCGLICGPIWGLAAGVLTPLISSLATSMPPMAILPGMLCELAVYGLVSGFVMSKLKIENITAKTYVSLISAMILGRVTYGILNSLIFMAGKYSLKLWLTAAFVTSIPGIIAQLIIIPVVILSLKKSKLL